METLMVSEASYVIVVAVIYKEDIQDQLKKCLC